MCRFLIAKSTKPFDPQALLENFASMAQKSRTVEGDRQEDGWGAAVRTLNQPWLVYKSLKPAWEDTNAFSQFSPTKLLLAHVRSASHHHPTGILEFNQPFTAGNRAFVFNGLARGVTLDRPVPGKIGAQKIFALLNQQLAKGKPAKHAVEQVSKLLINSSKSIRSINMALASGSNVAALCFYQESNQYFTLHHHQSEHLNIIASEPVGNYKYSKMKSGEVYVLG